MEKSFNILTIVFILVLLFGAYTIKKYENLYENNIAKSALYFQNPSRILLKVDCLVDEALFYIHKYEFHHVKTLTKSEILLLASKDSLKYNPKYKVLIKIIDSILYKIKNHQKVNVLKTSIKFHQVINKVSFIEYRNSIILFEKYKQNMQKVQTMLYIIITIILILSLVIFLLIHQSKLLKKIKFLSQTDHLTKTYNRRKFFEVMNIHKKEYSLIMFDIDHFKKINDTYGHDKGDFVLKTLIKIIKHNIRKDDMIFRWGGEEFFILFKNMDLEEATQTAEKLRKIVEEYDFNGMRVTISISVVTSKYGKEIEHIIKKLDEGLYEAKNSGRNKVVVKGEI